MKEYLEICANLASILTALLAASFFCQYRWSARKKRRKLEEYLKQKKAGSAGLLESVFTVVHLMAKLGLTEDEVFHASFQSKHIEARMAIDHSTGRATEVMFGYKESPDSN